MGEQNFQWPFDRLCDFGSERRGVFAVKVVASSFLLFKLLLACREERWDVAFVEEKDRACGGDSADNEENPEEPWPIQVFEDDAT